MNRHTIIAMLGLALSLSCIGVQAQQPALKGSPESIARAAKAFADSLPPLQLDAFAVVCVPVVEQAADFDASVGVAEHELHMGDPITPTLPGMRRAWAQKGYEYIPPTTGIDIGTLRNTGEHAVLHAGVNANGVCTVAWQITDTSSAGDPQDHARRVYQWIGTLESFTETDLNRDGARWVNEKARTVLLMTSNEDDVIFLHYGRL